MKRILTATITAMVLTSLLAAQAVAEEGGDMKKHSGKMMGAQTCKMSGMAQRRFIPTQDGGLVVVAGHKLLKYDKNLELLGKAALPASGGKAMRATKHKAKQPSAKYTKKSKPTRRCPMCAKQRKDTQAEARAGACPRKAKSRCAMHGGKEKADGDACGKAGKMQGRKGKHACPMCRKMMKQMKQCYSACKKMTGDGGEDKQ